MRKPTVIYTLKIVKFVILYVLLVCGSRAEKTFDHNNTRPDDSPWIVGVFYGDERARVFICSGSLISNKHVLVSGEKANDVLFTRDRVHYETQIRLGNDINYNGINTVKRNIVRIHVHKNFEEHRIFDYNIGILQMDRAVSFDNNIQPICLPQSPYVDYSGKLATAVGLYNSEAYKKPFHRSKSQITQIPIWTTDQCAEVHDYEGKLTYNMICAGDYAENGIRMERPYIRDVRSDDTKIVQFSFSILLF